MSLTEKINNDIKSAMLAREKEKLESLRAIKAALLLAKTEKNASEVTEEKEISILNKLLKQRKESAEIFNANGRQELAEKELFEASIIETYLPKMLDESAIIEVIKKIISENNFNSPSDFGKIMGMASKILAGKADNKIVSEKIKTLLS
ncbi:MAG: glutamyl-tRNA amidotransferase [Bacteroidetes bacterium GWF2_33_38]|nr:MAG: glutamyl-tRNA amidotransferase [Bacteroidetes bacterium GWF2_33_38]OFY74285.1 MAG: glutamyl-tRNA amidotransferase [Bacteroidetes bacterium RIFOXYA12_FULL_33_9]OFY87538.1 MAG: glutamyl-tRNA amidotransferase [Bacteroidetes bacterium RIFOXYA2_FULL_33_7]